MLIPIIETESGDNGICGPDGRSRCRSVISRLACSGCSSCFEVAREFRGLELHQYLESQLKGHKNPAKKPKDCRSCLRHLAQGIQTVDDQPLFNPPEADTTFLYCDICFKIGWVEKREAETRDP